MLVKQKITSVEEKMIEINLPAYFRKGETFYAITEEKITQVTYYDMITVRFPKSMFWESELAEITRLERATEAEFLAAYTQARINCEFKILQMVEPKSISMEEAAFFGDPSLVDREAWPTDKNIKNL